MQTLKALLGHKASYLLLFILLVALNLRAPITGFAPLLEAISADLHLSRVQSGLLTSLPLLAFAFFAPVVAWLSRYFRLEPMLLAGVALIALGMLTRSVGSISGLYVGVMVIGAGIAIGNVLLPSLLKRDFPEHIVPLTAMYVLMMSIGGFVMASSAVPLSLVVEKAWFPLSISGWSFALVCQMVLIILPLLVWLSGKIPPRPPSSISAAGKLPARLWRSLSAWQVTVFLAINSMMNYTMITWLPAILVSYGYSAATAGLYQGYAQLAGALPALLLTPFMAYLGSHRRLCLLTTGATWLSLLGLLFAPGWSGLWAVLFGFSICMGFILGLSFVGLRTENAKQAAALSGMSQLVGYCLAAVGPALFGALYDWQHSWLVPLCVLLVICAVWMITGWFASPKPVD